MTERMWALDNRQVLNTKRYLEREGDEIAMPFLLKTEPEVYSFADLQRDKETIWDGVGNATAILHLRNMKPGETLLIYHTSDEKRAVGTAKVVSVDASNPKVPLVKIKVGKAIKTSEDAG